MDKWEKIHRCLTLCMTPSLRTPQIIQRQEAEIKKKKFTHSSTCALSFPSCLPLSHTHTDMNVHTLGAVGPLSGDLRQSLDPLAPRWGQKLGQASAEPPSPRSQIHCPPVHGTWAARSLIQSWQQRAPLQPPAPSLTPAAPFPARWRGELTWEGRGEDGGVLIGWN